MADEITSKEKWRSRRIVFGWLFVGIALMLAPVLVDGVSYLTWIFGVPLVGVFGSVVVWAILFRLRHPSAEERARHREQLLDTGPGKNAVTKRMYFARRETRHKKDVLCGGVPGTAVVTLVADGHIMQGHDHLVYLELEVTVGDDSAYLARTGEAVPPVALGLVVVGRRLAVKVAPGDTARVAVDWDRSMLLPQH